MDRLIIVYDEGAAGPTELAVSLAERFSCVFVLAPSEHARSMEPVLAGFGQVVAEAETVRDTAARLRTHRPDGIVTYSDRALRRTSELAEVLDLPYHSRQTAEVLTDKVLQRSVLRDAGIGSVRFHPVGSEADWADAAAAVGFPAVLKPAHGASSRNTYLVEDADVGAKLVAQVLAQEAPGLLKGGGMILEEYLQGRPSLPRGDYVSVENFVCDGVVHDIAVTDKLPLAPPFRETACLWPSVLEPAEQQEIRELARAAVAALGVRSGLTHTEVKLTPHGPRIIEVNGRLGGLVSDLTRKAAGVDLIEFAGRLAVGESPVQEPIVPDHGIAQIFHLAPRQPARLVGIDGVEEVRALPAVTAYRPHVQVGARLGGGVHTRLLCVLHAQAPDPGTLPELVDQLNNRIRYSFEFEDGGPVRTVSAAQLADL